jgi:hypothetical protein
VLQWLLTCCCGAAAAAAAAAAVRSMTQSSGGWTGRSGSTVMERTSGTTGVCMAALLLAIQNIVSCQIDVSQRQRACVQNKHVAALQLRVVGQCYGSRYWSRGCLNPVKHADM